MPLLRGNDFTPWLASGDSLVKATAELTPRDALTLTFERLTGAGSGEESR